VPSLDRCTFARDFERHLPRCQVKKNWQNSNRRNGTAKGIQIPPLSQCGYHKICSAIPGKTPSSVCASKSSDQLKLGEDESRKSRPQHGAISTMPVRIEY
jgi:hypothetical protein